MCVTCFLLARIRKTRIAFLYPKHIYSKYRRVSVLYWSLPHYTWVLELYDRSVIENWFQRASRSPVITTSIHYLSGSMKTCVTVELFSPAWYSWRPGQNSGPEGRLYILGLFAVYFITSRKLAEWSEIGRLLDFQTLCLLWSPKMVTALKGICHLAPSCGLWIMSASSVPLGNFNEVFTSTPRHSNWFLPSRHSFCSFYVWSHYFYVRNR
jgi:hypothetical protein